MGFSGKELIREMASTRGDSLHQKKFDKKTSKPKLGITTTSYLLNSDTV